MRWGQRLRAIRCAHGISISALARRTSYSRQHLSQVELGDRRPTRDMARLLDIALGTGGELEAMLDHPDGVEVSCPARPTPDTAPRPLAEANAETSFGMIAHLTGLDTLVGADAIASAAESSYLGLRRRLSVTRSPSSQLRAAVAELGQVSAWLAHDAGDGGTARRLLHEALVDAELSGGPIRWLIMDQLSMLSSWYGQTGDALAWADRGLDSTPAGVVQGVMRMRRARALAAYGASEAADEMQRARTMIEAGPVSGDPAWSWWINASELRLHESMMLSDLGRKAEAVDAAGEACELIPARQVRDASVYAARRMAIQATAGDWRGMVETANGMAGLPSARVRRMIADLRRDWWGSAPAYARDALESLDSGRHQ